MTTTIVLSPPDTEASPSPAARGSRDIFVLLVCVVADASPATVRHHRRAQAAAARSSPRGASESCPERPGAYATRAQGHETGCTKRGALASAPQRAALRLRDRG